MLMFSVLLFVFVAFPELPPPSTFPVCEPSPHTEQAVREELSQLLDLLDKRSQTLAAPSELPAEVPLTLHARYSRREVIAALGAASGVKPKITQGGILWLPSARADALFVDLRQGRVRLLAIDDVSRLCDQPHALPLGVPSTADARAANRPALHQPPGRGHPNP